MSANEKHAATYHGAYTPNVDELRDAWVDNELDPLPRSQAIELVPKVQAAFDGWLETVRAEAKAEALEEVVETLEEASCPEHGSAIAPIKGVHWKATDRFADWLRTRANQYKEDTANGR